LGSLVEWTKDSKWAEAEWARAVSPATLHHRGTEEPKFGTFPVSEMDREENRAILRAKPHLSLSSNGTAESRARSKPMYQTRSNGHRQLKAPLPELTSEPEKKGFPRSPPRRWRTVGDSNSILYRITIYYVKTIGAR